MPFEKVDTQVDFPAQERAVLRLLGAASTPSRSCASKNRGKPRWSFLDGPITANNPMGVHHAWGRTYKDAYQRYFAMTGHELRYQNGFDCQGLWVEVEVEKELKLQVQARHREPRPRRPLRQHRPLRAAVQGARRQVRPRADGAVDPPRLLDGLGPRRRLAKAARPAPQLLHDVGGEQLHHLDLPQEVPRARPDLPRLRRHALVPALRASA